MRRPILWVFVADLWWGVSALFWRELDTVAPIDQLGWRVTTGFGLLALFWLLRRRHPLPGGLTKRHVLYAIGGAAFIFSNWAVFLWAIANEQAVDAALGYFLAPVIQVALAVGVLREVMRPAQKLAVIIATAGIVWMVTIQGGLPWVALVLAGSFGCYGLLRKMGPWDAVNGLTAEMGIVAPLTILLLVVRSGAGNEIAGDASLFTWALIVLTGFITAVPLILFAGAARAAPLVVVGLMQYVVPIAQFIVGWWILGESVPLNRLIGFAIVWAALVLVVFDELRNQRLQRPVDRVEPSFS
ncbi:MAG: EamA family transporter RarD [Acidimicrobiales bacterium]|nr:EamA family transporter RarD [Acidimicrobiales bacterium]RZV45490.1 MAG: EamA family transporter RarD [Acidimicrobiales bacterium]